MYGKMLPDVDGIDIPYDNSDENLLHIEQDETGPTYRLILHSSCQHGKISFTQQLILTQYAEDTTI